MMSADGIHIFQPLEMISPLFKVRVTPFKSSPNRHTIYIHMEEDGQPFDRSTTVTFFVTMPLDVIRQYFPTCEVGDPI